MGKSGPRADRPSLRPERERRDGTLAGTAFPILDTAFLASNLSIILTTGGV
jgi:hypothetical protein